MTETAATETKPLPSDIKVERPSYEELVKMVNVISKPMASKKLTKKIYKLVKKSSKVGFSVDFLLFSCQRDIVILSIE